MYFSRDQLIRIRGSWRFSSLPLLPWNIMDHCTQITILRKWTKNNPHFSWNVLLSWKVKVVFFKNSGSKDSSVSRTNGRGWAVKSQQVLQDFVVLKWLHMFVWFVFSLIQRWVSALTSGSSGNRHEIKGKTF